MKKKNTKMPRNPWDRFRKLRRPTLPKGKKIATKKDALKKRIKAVIIEPE